MNPVNPLSPRTAPPTSPSRPGAPAGPAAAGDQVTLGGGSSAAPLIPRPEARADAPADGAASSLSVGRKVALGVGLAVVGLGGLGILAGGGAAEAHAQTPSQSVSREAGAGQVSSAALSRAEKRALGNLDLLQQVGQRNGGGLERQQFLWHVSTTVPEAYQELSQGHPVFYLESKDAAAHELRDFQQLDSLAGRVREQEAKREIREGVEQIKEGARELGDAIREGLDRIFK